MWQEKITTACGFWFTTYGYDSIAVDTWQMSKMQNEGAKILTSLGTTSIILGNEGLDKILNLYKIWTNCWRCMF